LIPTARTSTTTTTAAPATGRAVGEGMASHALAILAPTWNTWVLQTLAQHPDGMRRADLTRALPFVPTGSLANSLAGLGRAGLFDRPDNLRHAGTQLYRITDAGRAALPVHRQMADWARAHVCPGEVLPLAEAAEIGFTQIRGMHTLDVLAVVRAVGEAAPVDLRHVRPRSNAMARSNFMIDALELGLIDRVAHGRYALSAAGRDLQPVLEALTAFAQRRPPRTAAAARLTGRATAPAQTTVQPSAPSRAIAAAPRPAVAPPRTAPATGAAKPARPVPAVSFSHPDLPRPAAVSAGRGR
jgi:DNA-binding HxlR family transcriptional regulator